MYSCHFMLLWHCLTLWQANSGHWAGRKTNKQKEWNIFSVGLMNKIDSAENLLSSSSAAAEKSWIMQLRKREKEGRQLYLRNQLSLHGELPRTKEWKKKTLFAVTCGYQKWKTRKLRLSRCLSPKTWLGAIHNLWFNRIAAKHQFKSSPPDFVACWSWGNFLLLTNINHIA